MKKNRRSLTFPKYISSIHKISKGMLHTGALISLAELIALGYCIFKELQADTAPLFSVYIPMIRTVLVFAFFILLFSLLFDYLYRKENA